VRFFLRDLYNRVSSNSEIITSVSERLDESCSNQAEISEKILNSTTEQINGICGEISSVRGDIQSMTDENHTRYSAVEQKIGELSEYRTATELRMSGDDLTTIQLAHRVELIERALREHHMAEQPFELFNKKSYSQSGEDAIIMYVAAMLGIPLSECTYLDLGANSPKSMSNTYFFYEQGARGVLVEANCSLIPALETERQGDTVLNMCISGKSGEKLPFSVLNLDGLSKVGDVSDILAANPEAELIDVIELETITVGDIIEKYMGGKAPVIMNLDIEGMEKQILDSIDFTKYRPMIMIIEMIPYSTKLTAGVKDKELLDYVCSKGYIEYAFTGINSIFIDSRRLDTDGKNL
jgi:FkbM family methyltransferase